MAKTKLTTAQQIDHVKTLIGNFTAPLMDNVHRLECPTPFTTHAQNVGANPKDSLKGYAYLLQSHRLRHYDTLSSDDSDMLQDNACILLHLATDLDTLAEIQSKSKFEDISHAYQDYAATKYEELVYTDTMIMVGGNARHFTINSMTQDGSSTHITSYNAGAESLHHPFYPGYVLGMVTRKVTAGTEADLKEFITNQAAKRAIITSAQYSILSAQTEKMLENKVTAFTTVPAQHKGNCTTRSIREFLRHRLPAELFNPIYALASNSTSVGHSIALHDHLRALEKQQQQEQQPSIHTQRLAIEALYQQSKQEQLLKPERARELRIALQSAPPPTSHTARLDKHRPSPLQPILQSGR